MDFSHGRFKTHGPNLWRQGIITPEMARKKHTKRGFRGVNKLTISPTKKRAYFTPWFHKWMGGPPDRMSQKNLLQVHPVTGRRTTPPKNMMGGVFKVLNKKHPCFVGTFEGVPFLKGTILRSIFPFCGGGEVNGAFPKQPLPPKDVVP